MMPFECLCCLYYGISVDDFECVPTKTYLESRQKMEFSIKDFFSKCDQIRRKLPEHFLHGTLHFLCNETSTMKIINEINN